MKLHVRHVLLATSLVALSITTATMTRAAKPGGGKPTLPPVRFWVDVVAYPANSQPGGELRDVNNYGEAVGTFPTIDAVDNEVQAVQHAFVYSPSRDADQAVDVHQLVADQIADQIGSDWYLRSLTGINDTGVAVGYLGQYGQSIYERRKACVLYGAMSGTPLLVVLPDRAGEGSEPWPVTGGPQNKINDRGLVAVTFETALGNVGVYVMDPLMDASATVLPVALFGENLGLNNADQVAGQLVSGAVFRHTVGDASPEVFSQFNYYAREAYEFMGLNDAGAFCGRRTVRNQYQAWRFNGSLLAVTASSGGSALNSSGDMSIWGLGVELYHEGTGLLQADELVVGATGDMAQWNAAPWRFLIDLSERGAWNADPAVNNYPGLAGHSRDFFFLLTPVKP